MTFFFNYLKSHPGLVAISWPPFVDSSTCPMTVDVKEMKIQILVSPYVLVSFTLLSFLVLNFMSFIF